MKMLKEESVNGIIPRFFIIVFFPIDKSHDCA